MGDISKIIRTVREGLGPCKTLLGNSGEIRHLNFSLSLILSHLHSSFSPFLDSYTSDVWGEREGFTRNCSSVTISGIKSADRPRSRIHCARLNPGTVAVQSTELFQAWDEDTLRHFYRDSAKFFARDGNKEIALVTEGRLARVTGSKTSRVGGGRELFSLRVYA